MTAQSQPLLSVADVPAASAWYQQVLAARSSHGGDEYERLESDGQMVLQLHRWETDHHHGPIGDPQTRPYGNGVAVWFEVDDFDAAVERARASGARVEVDVHVNPNARHREIWLRDIDGYLVVLSSPDGDPAAS